MGAAIQYQDESYSSADRGEPVRAAVVDDDGCIRRRGQGRWNAELYVTNLTDENKSVYTIASQFILVEVPMRPRTIGLRFGYSFGGN